MNIITKIKSLLGHKSTPTEQELVLSLLADQQRRYNEHLVAIARLSFIHPETLVREAQNMKANTEYLGKMIEELEKQNKETK